MHDLRMAIDFVDKHADAFLEYYAPDAPILYSALCAAEDHRASYHSGIDTRSISRGALVAARDLRRIRGISTIEQQLARTIFPRRGRNLLLAKIDELVLAWQLSKSRPKIALWSAYLMAAYYGSDLNGYGSAKRKFVKRGQHLSAFQASQIVSCLKYPRPRTPSSAWLRRHEIRTAYVVDRLPTISTKLLDPGKA
jgi:penicillin-binding protein 1A